MSLVRRALERSPGDPTEARNVNLSRYLSWVSDSFSTPSGVFVDQDTAMRHDAVWSCVTAIAQDVAMMPVDVVRYVNGAREDVSPTPQIIGAPSVLVGALDWRYQIVESWLLAGNALGRVTATDPSGRYPTRIELLSPSQCSPDGMNPGHVMVDGKSEALWPVGPIWHVPAYTMPGSWWGLSPIEYHRAKIGAGLAAGRFGEDFFGKGGHPSAILAPETDPGVEGAKAMKASFLRAAKGREPAVLPQSITYTPIQISPNDSQFIDAMRYSVEQVCRIYREDPADHGASAGTGGSITYANRSDADLARFKRRQFWVTKLQDALTAFLPQPQVVKLNTSASLMMTPMERHQLHALRLGSRTTTVNEVRDIEDEPKFGPEYDEPGIPVEGNHAEPDPSNDDPGDDMNGAAA